MKKGWIQLKQNGALEDIAPKTLANQVYMDDNQTQTVKQAIEEIGNNATAGGTTPRAVTSVAGYHC